MSWGCDGVVGVELLVQLAVVVPPFVVPQNMVTVVLAPPLLVTLPFAVAVEEVTLEAEERVMVGRLAEVVKLSEAAGQLVPAELVALAEK